MNSDPIADRPAERDSFLARHWQKLVAALLWLSLLGGLVAYMQINELSVSGLLREVIRLMQTPWGPLLFFVVYALRPLTFFSATVLTLAAGSLFGPLLGIVYTVIASNTSATVAYFMGRLLGGGLLDESEEDGIVQRYADRMRDNSFETTLTMRFIFLPYDLVSYLAGLLRIDFKAFILATILGSLPGTISFVLAGASVPVDNLLQNNFRPSFNPWALAASVLIFVVSLAFSRYLKGRTTTDDRRPTTDNGHG